MPYREYCMVFECGTVVTLRLPRNITRVQIDIRCVGSTPAGPAP